jgi:hypothetical protein
MVLKLIYLEHGTCDIKTHQFSATTRNMGEVAWILNLKVARSGVHAASTENYFDVLRDDKNVKLSL